MKLSEAILKGCKIVKKQAHGALFEDISDNETGTPVYAACVLGAAAVGAGLVKVDEVTKREWDGNPDEVFAKLRKKFPQLTKPAYGFKLRLNDEFGEDKETDLEDYTISRNDEQELPRYKIARRLAAVGL